MNYLILSKSTWVLPEVLRIILAIAGSLFALLFAVALSVVLIRMIFITYRKTLTLEKTIRIKNQGNADSIFRISAESQKDRLKFEYSYQGEKLPQAVLTLDETGQDENQPEVEQMVKPAQPAGDVQKPAPNKFSSSAKSVKNKSKLAINLGRQVGSLLGALGTFIPGSVGSSLKEKASALQNSTQKASEVIAAPDQKKREAEHIQSQIKNMAGSKEKDETAVSAEKSAAPISQPVTQMNKTAAPKKENKKTKTRKIIAAGLVQTPQVLPGGTLQLKMNINPDSIYRSGEFAYRIKSYQLSQVDDEMVLVNTAITDDEIKIKGVSTLHGALYFLLLILAVSLNGLWLFFFLNWLIGNLF